MGGTKRMSIEEKRKVVLGIYHKTKQVFTEKEIIALATKAGVNANTVAEVNQSLVDDGEVDKEKIGGANYFWSFPAKKDRKKQLQHTEILKEIDRMKLRLTEAQAKLADAKRGREDENEEDNNNKDGGDGGGGGGGRAKKLARLEEIAKEHKAGTLELQKLKENDPRALANLQKEYELVMQGANRWTDNIFSCKAYLTKKRGMASKEACKFLGITQEFDYPEDNA